MAQFVRAYGKPVRRLQEGVGVVSTRMIATVTGWLFLITFITSIPAAFVLYPPVLNDPNFIVSAGGNSGVRLGALLEVILVVANIGTAVVLYPLVKRQNHIVALGYVTARVVEATVIAVGIISLLAVVMLRHDFAGVAGADTASLSIVGSALVAVHDATFLLGPGFLAPLGNGILLGFLIYRSDLVPRAMAMLGLIGGPLLIASFVAILFGIYKQVSLPQRSPPSRRFCGSSRSALILSSRGSCRPRSSRSMSVTPCVSLLLSKAPSSAGDAPRRPNRH
jgi:hypothetical protein